MSRKELSGDKKGSKQKTVNTKKNMKLQAQEEQYTPSFDKEKGYSTQLQGPVKSGKNQTTYSNSNENLSSSKSPYKKGFKAEKLDQQDKVSAPASQTDGQKFGSLKKRKTG